MTKLAETAAGPSTRFVWSAAVVIAAVVGVAYWPALDLGFLGDDWIHLGNLSRLGAIAFVASEFNPFGELLLNTYRPFQALSLAANFVIFGPNPVALHLINLVVHAANAMILAVVCREVTPDRRYAVLAGLLYASLPVYSVAVLLINAPDTLGVLFYLLAVWSWLRYLRGGRLVYAALTALTFICGLLAKEFVITLPATLFLLDRLLVRGPTGLVGLLRRYLPLLIISGFYVALELVVQPRSTNFQTYRMTFGPHMVVNALPFLTHLTFPWYRAAPDPFVWLPPVLIFFALAVFRTKSALLLFLGAEILLAIFPVLGIQGFVGEIRHLYLAGIGSALLLALVIHQGLRIRAVRQWRVAVAVLASVLLLSLHTGIITSASEYAAMATVQRAPFRDVSRQHPEIPEGTMLFFVEPPTSVPHLSGMFRFRYGERVTVGGTHLSARANLRDHANTLIYYFDPTGKPREVQIGTNSTNASPSPPVRFGDSIRLEGYELAADTVRRGEPLIALLYWQAARPMDRDYTVFAHLIDSAGKIVQGKDSQPRDGHAPTSSWFVEKLVVDSILMPIEPEVRAGREYALEVGLYYLPTMEAVPIVDIEGRAVADCVRIGPLTISE